MRGKLKMNSSRIERIVDILAKSVSIEFQWNGKISLYILSFVFSQSTYTLFLITIQQRWTQIIRPKSKKIRSQGKMRLNRLNRLDSKKKNQFSKRKREKKTIVKIPFHRTNFPPNKMKTVSTNRTNASPLFETVPVSIKRREARKWTGEGGKTLNRSFEENGDALPNGIVSIVDRFGQRNWQGFRLFREGVSCHSAFLSWRRSRATSTNLAMVKGYAIGHGRGGGGRSNKIPGGGRHATPRRSITGAIHFRSPRRLTNWSFVNLHLKRGGQARRGIDFFPPCLGD